MRGPILAAFAAVMAALTLAAFVPVEAAAFDRAANERTLLQLINHARTQRGLRPVAGARALHRVAVRHSRDMLVRDYFAHSSSARSTGTWSVGEIIGWGRSYLGTPQSVFKRWMRSPAHRSILLGSRWRAVGVGCARGTFCGASGAIMYTVDFARRVR